MANKVQNKPGIDIRSADIKSEQVKTKEQFYFPKYQILAENEEEAKKLFEGKTKKVAKQEKIEENIEDNQESEKDPN